MAAINQKDRQIQLYYAESVGEGKFKTFKRRFLHKKGGGLWASMRDLRQSEIVTNTTIDFNSTLFFTVNYNPRIIENWKKTLWVIFRGITYRVEGKPDEFNYQKGDIKLNCAEVIDSTVYIEDIYDND